MKTKTTLKKTDPDYETSWNVEFVGDYFVLTTSVVANDEEEAEKEAVKLLKDHYGWDLESTSFEVTAKEIL